MKKIISYLSFTIIIFMMLFISNTNKAYASETTETETTENENVVLQYPLTYFVNDYGHEIVMSDYKDIVEEEYVSYEIFFGEKGVGTDIEYFEHDGLLTFYDETFFHGYNVVWDSRYLIKAEFSRIWVLEYDGGVWTASYEVLDGDYRQAFSDYINFDTGYYEITIPRYVLENYESYMKYDHENENYFEEKYPGLYTGSEWNVIFYDFIHGDQEHYFTYRHYIPDKVVDTEVTYKLFLPQGFWNKGNLPDIFTLSYNTVSVRLKDSEIGYIAGQVGQSRRKSILDYIRTNELYVTGIPQNLATINKCDDGFITNNNTWLVPSIIVVMFLGGFFAVLRKKREE